MGFLDTVIKDSGNEFASIVSDGVAAGDVDNYVDTGSYIFNALVSGSLYGGIPSNKVTALAVASSTGKTNYALSVDRNYLFYNAPGNYLHNSLKYSIKRIKYIILKYINISLKFH